MWIGTIEFDVLLADVRSRKQKRSVVRPLIAELRRHFEVSAAEVGHVDLRRRTLIGAAIVTLTPGHAAEVLDRMERLVAERPEIELLEVHRRVINTLDE